MLQPPGNSKFELVGHLALNHTLARNNASSKNKASRKKNMFIECSLDVNSRIESKYVVLAGYVLYGELV